MSYFMCEGLFSGDKLKHVDRGVFSSHNFIPDKRYLLISCYWRNTYIYGVGRLKCFLKKFYLMYRIQVFLQYVQNPSLQLKRRCCTSQFKAQLIVSAIYGSAHSCFYTFSYCRDSGSDVFI